MRMLALKCEFCGAPLDFPADTPQAQCLYCSNQILIDQAGFRGSSAPPKPTADKSASGDVKKEIVQLDREWEAYRAKYLNRDEKGAYDIPVEEHCRVGMWATVVLGAVAVILIMISGPPASFVVAFTILVLALVGGTLIGLQRQMNIARVYVRSKRNYEQERLRLLNKLPAA